MEKALTRFEAAINSLGSDMDTRLNAIETQFDMKFKDIGSNFNASNSKFNYLLALITALGSIARSR